MSGLSPATRAWLGWLAVALGAAALLAGGQRARAQDVTPEATATPPIDGAELYASRCAACHGSAGQGGQTPSGAAAPRLRGAPVALVDLVLRTGRMPPGQPDGSGHSADPLDSRRREALLAWMDPAFELTGTIPDDFGAQRADPARGQEVYAANCQQCHGSTGAGGVAGAGAFTPMLLNRDPVLIAEAIRLGPFQMPAFGRDVISDQEVADVIAFLDEVAHESGTPLGIHELNPVYAGAFVFLLALAALLSAMWLSGRVALFPDRGEQPGGSTDASGERGP